MSKIVFIKGFNLGFIVITLNLVTILVVFTIYVLKLRQKKLDVNSSSNNKSLFVKNKINTPNLFARNETTINDVPVDDSNKIEINISKTSLSLGNDINVNKTEYLERYVV